jgi:hypothetical protein
VGLRFAGLGLGAILHIETTGEGDAIPMQAYDPVDGWHGLTEAPLPQACGIAVMWTGDHLIAWGGGERGSDRTQRGAIYDAATDTWATIPDAPIGLNASDGVWTGSEMIVIGSELSGANRASTLTARRLPPRRTVGRGVGIDRQILKAGARQGLV